MTLERFPARAPRRAAHAPWLSLLVLGGAALAGAACGGGDGAPDGAAGIDGALPDGAGDAGGGACAPFDLARRVWTTREIDVIGGAPIYPDLTIDPAGRPVVAFTKGTSTSRWAAVASFDGASWSAPDAVETEDGLYLGKRPSVAVTGDGAIHVVAYDEDRGRPRHSHKAPGEAWTTVALHEEGVDAGDHSALAIDATGGLHLTFLEYGTYHLVYGRRADGAWELETIAGGAGPIEAGSASLALGAGTIPQVAWYTGLPDDHLRFSARAGGAWTDELVDGDAETGHYAELALGPDGEPWIVALRWSEPAEVRVAHRRGGAWSVETVDTGLGITYTTGIAALPCGELAIAYARNEGEGAQGLWVAVRDADGAWSKASVDSSTYVSGIDLALDPAGRLHAVYLDETNFVLRHAEAAPE